MSELDDLRKRNLELESQVAGLQARLEAHLHESALLRDFDHALTRHEKTRNLVAYGGAWIADLVQAEHSAVALWDQERGLFELEYRGGQPHGIHSELGKPVIFPRELTPPLDRVSPGGVLWNHQGISLDLRRTDGSLMGLLYLEREQNLNQAESRLVRECADRFSVALHHTMVANRFHALSQYRSQLFRMLSHDLRQPLTVLKGYADLLKFSHQMGNSALMGEYLEKIGRGSQDLSDLLEDVLLSVQIENPSRQDWEEISLRRVCEQAMEKHASLAELKHQQVEVQFTQEPTPCRGMSVQLREAASNFISNAIKYTPEGGQIKLALWVEGERIYFEVTDSGFGISKERQARLFEAFYRAQEPGTEEIKGTGIGLSLVKGIIENHDGEVYFTSERGKGSTFGFWLPLVEK
jgi:signal transduction histidine kinase